jgi:hypothetical protein
MEISLLILVLLILITILFLMIVLILFLSWVAKILRFEYEDIPYGGFE